MKTKKRTRVLLPLMLICMLVASTVTSSFAAASATTGSAARASGAYSVTTDKTVYEKGEPILVTSTAPATDKKAWIGIIKSGKAIEDKYGSAPYYWYYYNSDVHGDCRTDFDMLLGEFTGDVNYQEYDADERALMDRTLDCLNPGTYDIVILSDDSFVPEAKTTIVIDGTYGISYMHEDHDFGKMSPSEYKYSDVLKASVKLPAGVPSGYEVKGHQFAGWYDNKALKGNAYTELPKGSVGNKVFYAKFEPKPYKVTFDVDGGSAVAAQTVYYGKEASEPAAPKKDGYVFLGWAADKNGKAAFNFDEPIQGATTIYAKWAPVGTPVVKFDTTGGNTVISQGVKSGATASVPVNPVREAYVFDKWVTEKGGNTAFNFNTPITGDTTVYAAWKPYNYTITFDGNGGSKPASVTYNIESATFALPTATKEKYIFAGWKDESGKVYQEIPKGTYGNMKLTAVWDPYISLKTDKETYLNGEDIMVTACCDLPGAWVGLYSAGSKPGSTGGCFYYEYPQDYYDVPFNLLEGEKLQSLNVGKYEVFLLTEDYDVLAKVPITIEKNNNPLKGTLKVSGYSRDDKIYSGIAEKEKKEKKTIYDFYYGDEIAVEVSLSGLDSVKKGAWVGILAEADYASGNANKYLPEKWYYVQDFEGQKVNLNYILENNISEKAKPLNFGLNYWIILASKDNEILDAVPFNYRTFNMDWLNSTWGPAVSEKMKIETEWTTKLVNGENQKPAVTFTRVNGHFGMVKNADGSLTEITEEVLKEGQDYTLEYPAESKVPGTYTIQVKFPSGGKANYLSTSSKNYGLQDGIPYYLKSAMDEFVIQYELNDGVNHKNNPEKYKTGKAVPLYAPAKSGCVFAGWYTEADFRESSKISEIPANAAQDYMLYAKWLDEANATYKIHYVLNGGINSISNPSGYYGDEEVGLVPAKKAGYRFDGWFLDADFTVPADNIKAGTTGDITVYAKYTKLTSDTVLIKTSVKGGVISSNVRTQMGKDVTVTYKPNKNYVLSSVKVDGENVDIEKYASSYTFENLTADHQIDVVYKIKLGKAKISKIKTANGKIQIYWKSVKRAKEYRVYRSANGKSYKYIGKTTELNYLDANVKAGKKYYYKVAAAANGSIGTKSAKKSIKASKPLTRAKITSISAKNSKVTLKWKKVKNADSYKVYRSADGGKTYKFVIKTKKLSFTTTKKQAAKTYRYKVVTVKNGIEGKMSVAKVIKVKAKNTSNQNQAAATLGKVKIIDTMVRKTTINVTYQKVNGAEKYQVYRASAENGTYELAGTTSMLSFTDKNLTPGKQYFYKIRALKTVNGKKKYGSYSAVETATTNKSSDALSSLIVKGQENKYFFNPQGKDGDSIADVQGRNYFSDEELKVMLNKLEALAAKCKAQGAEFVFFVAPNKETFYEEYLPAALRGGDVQTTADQVVAYIKANSDIKVVYAMDALLEVKAKYPHWGLYFDTDTHWNSLGGYIGTRALMAELGIQMEDVSPENVKLDSNAGPGDISSMIETTESLYEKNSYSVEVNSTVGILTREQDFTTEFRYKTTSANPQKLFMVRDSFCSYMADYIAPNYSESVMMHTNYFKPEMIDTENPDVVVYEVVERYLGKVMNLNVE